MLASQEGRCVCLLLCSQCPGPAVLRERGEGPPQAVHKLHDAPGVSFSRAALALTARVLLTTRLCSGRGRRADSGG